MQQIGINSFNGCKFVNICNINLGELFCNFCAIFFYTTKLLKLNPDPNIKKKLDPDPQKRNADPQPWSHT